MPSTSGAPAVRGLQGRDLLSLADLGSGDVATILDAAARLKLAQANGVPHTLLPGRTLGMLFEKASLRTRTTFVVGMVHLGGQAVDLMAEHTQMGVRESAPDIARNLERWVDGVMARVYDQHVLEELAEHARVPVINGLSDRFHPCQVLADLLTLREHVGSLSGRTLAYVGDGFNVCHSLLLGGALTGLHVRVGTPRGYEPDPAIVEQARGLARASGASIEVVSSAEAAVRDADAVYTDSWVSMGLEDERAERLAAFGPFQVNADLMAAAQPHAVFMHCLPAHRGQEVTDDVMDGPQSVVFDQAENRLHAQKALLVLLIGGEAALEALPQ
ncbi:MAG: ornithine carbamoyltransferase [Chloroflexi bacterium]|nr:ornithine carbamoyltransferase [Chloroflexota bacterium]MCY4110963.1 ornithine carbamoyltransferase [Chloroflexota bacterium]